jgi:hypothetical protein
LTAAALGPATTPSASLAPRVVAGWERLAAILAIPALVVGAFLYPDVQHDTMPLWLAAGIVLAVGIALVGSGQARLLVLLPLVAAYLPSPQVGFVGYAVALGYFAIEYGATRLATPLDGVDWALIALLAWTLLSWAANLGDQTDMWSLGLFAVTFLSPWLLLFLARAAPWSADELRTMLRTWLALAAVQLVPALLKPLLVGMPGAYTVPLVTFQLTGIGLLRNLLPTSAADMTAGTTIEAPHLGSALVLLCVLLFAYRIAARQRRFPVLLLLAGYVFLMTDSKHQILAMMPAVVWYVHAVVWPVFPGRVRRRVNAVLLLLLVVGSSYVADRLTVAVRDYWQPYQALASVNPKAQLFSRTARLLEGNTLHTWLGYGPGAFGSRAASIRATDVLFKEGNRLPSFIPPHTAPGYASVAYDLYTSDIVETAKFRSGALTNPFSSLIGVVAEYGLVGTGIVALFFVALGRAGYRCWRTLSLDPAVRAVGATAGFAVAFLVGLSPFDTYFEQPDVTAPMVVLLLIALAAVANGSVTKTRDELDAGLSG